MVIAGTVRHSCAAASDRRAPTMCSHRFHQLQNPAAPSCSAYTGRHHCAVRLRTNPPSKWHCMHPTWEQRSAACKCSGAAEQLNARPQRRGPSCSVASAPRTDGLCCAGMQFHTYGCHSVQHAASAVATQCSRGMRTAACYRVCAVSQAEAQPARCGLAHCAGCRTARSSDTLCAGRQAQ